VRHEIDLIDSGCYSYCGTFISLRDRYGYPVYPPWTLPPRCLGRVAEQQMPRVLYPSRVLHSSMWGDDEVFLHGYNQDGRFILSVNDAGLHNEVVLLKHILPNYLVDVDPVVVLGNARCPQIQLVFLIDDRSPELMILPQTWDSVVKTSIDSALAHPLQGLTRYIYSLADLLKVDNERRQASKHMFQ